MLFVPFTVPTFTPTVAATVTTLPNMGTPKVSMGDNGNKIMVLSSGNNNSLPYVEHYKDLKTGWVSSSTVTTSGNAPTLMAVPPIMTQQPVNTSAAPTLQAVTAVPVQLKSTASIVAPIMANPPKPDTSSSLSQSEENYRESDDINSIDFF